MYMRNDIHRKDPLTGTHVGRPYSRNSPRLQLNESQVYRNNLESFLILKKTNHVEPLISDDTYH